MVLWRKTFEDRKSGVSQASVRYSISTLPCSHAYFSISMLPLDVSGARDMLQWSEVLESINQSNLQ